MAETAQATKSQDRWPGFFVAVAPWLLTNLVIIHVLVVHVHGNAYGLQSPSLDISGPSVGQLVWPFPGLDARNWSLL